MSIANVSTNKLGANNVYDVTNWPFGNAYEDIGSVINSIIAHIKERQNSVEHGIELSEGKPGAVIYIPPGDYHLKTQILIDISYLRIEGSGHGFISSSIRFNTEQSALEQYQDIWPGGSRILVDLPVKNEQVGTSSENCSAAILIKREGLPRISSVELVGFCIDGLHFTNKSGQIDENSYLNGKTGLYVDCANDSFCIRDMGFIYLEHAVAIREADALTIDNNFIAECGSCVELLTCGQACKVANNLIGAGYCGHSIYAENYGGLLISANNVFPRGRSSIHLLNVSRSNIASNRLHSFYPGMVILEGQCCENLISSNHLLRDPEPWAPMQGFNNGINDDYGLVHINGANNSVIANHISSSIAPEHLVGSDHSVIIKVNSGNGNYIANNHIVATDPSLSKELEVKEASSCFATQVEAMTRISNLKPFEKVCDVVLESATHDNQVIFTARKDKYQDQGLNNVVMAL